jgi:ABC-type multidrug transport system fused ATPase/permease subunit
MLPNLRRFLAIYRGYEQQFFISQVLLGVAALFTLFIPMLSQSLVNEVLIGGDRTAIFRTVLGMVVFAAVSAVFTMANAWYTVGFSEHTAHVVRLYLYKKMQSFSFSDLGHHSAPGDSGGGLCRLHGQDDG